MTDTTEKNQGAERLKIALFLGQHSAVRSLLAAEPSLGSDNFGLQCAMYDVDGVRAVLGADPTAATRIVGVRQPILHLAFSKHFQSVGNAKDMLSVANLLLAAGADVNASYPAEPGSVNMLSALYGALGHADNVALGRWLLDHGADPDDGESLYHATEHPTTDGLRLLLDHGVTIGGTNALPRALDFNDPEKVRLLLAAGADPNEGIHQHASGEPSFVIPALHQAARRMCNRDIAAMLLDAGADPNAVTRGHSAYAFARMFANAPVAEEIAARGGSQQLTGDEALIVAAVDGTSAPDDWIDPTGLPDETRDLIRTMLALPGALPRIKRLVALGMEVDRPDPMGLTPLHIAGWEGLPDIVAYLMRQPVNLDHVNGYGGTLLGTIIHGSENCPARTERDHGACARLALEAGLELHQNQIDFAGDPAMVAFLTDWAKDHPDQLVGDGGG